MAKTKKNGTYLNVCIDTKIYKKLDKHCVNVGQTKTIAVERALSLYLEEHENLQKKLKELDYKVSI